MLQRISPDVISLDIRLPGMDGFDTTRRIMRDKPTPIVVCSASVESEDLEDHDERAARRRACRSWRSRSAPPAPSTSGSPAPCARSWRS